MRKIAVLIHSLTIEYSLSVLNGIRSYFKDKDVTLVVAQIKTPHYAHRFFDYQCWTGIKYLCSEQIDGIIVLTGSFVEIETEVLENELRKAGGKPVVSVGIELSLPNSIYTSADCETAYTGIISHLKEKHGCSTIAFMSANLTKSREAEDRFKAYKTGLKNNGLKYRPELVLDGEFTSSSAIRAFNEKYSSKAQIEFDAIIAANDLMAIGCSKALAQLDVEIPNEVRLIGFDDTSHAASNFPKISTINQQISEHGRLAAELILKKLDGQNVEKRNPVRLMPIYRQSCGCVPLSNMGGFYKNDEGKMCAEASSTPIEQQTPHFNYLLALENTYTIFDIANTSCTLMQFTDVLKNLMGITRISAMSVCLFDRPISLSKTDDFNLPDELEVKIFIDNSKDICEYEPGLHFNPHKEIFPKICGQEPGSANYILQPIFSREANYGIAICRTDTEEYAIYNVYLKIIINAIANAYEYTMAMAKSQELQKENEQLQVQNTNLDIQTRTDELTKCLNRRGFMEIGQKSISIALEINKKGLIFFIDMDNLKSINDNYGHETGDTAIKLLADVLNLSFRANDITARLSGDEFAVLATGMEKSHITKLRRKIDNYCHILSEENGLPFTLSCSIGYAEFSKDKSVLQAVLAEADDMLYEEKMRKHPDRKYKRKTII